MRVLDCADDGANRAVSCTQGTALTFVCVDVVGEQGLADACRTAFLFDMCLVLIAEVAEGGKHRVWSRLAKTAGGVFLDVVAELFELV